MDTSPVQSSSKCGSDFSIERILSNETTRNSLSESVQTPDWLCCTRYRPPRVPRAVSGAGCRVRRSGRHARVPFTAAQAAALEAAYARAPYLAPPALRALAAALQLRDDRIKIWFQNRRARERREKCANVAPPLSVTLPPTTTAHVSWLAANGSWISTGSDMNHQPLNINTAMKCQNSSSSERIAMYDRDKVVNEMSSLSESTDEDCSNLPLDIETIED